MKDPKRQNIKGRTYYIIIDPFIKKILMNILFIHKKTFQIYEILKKEPHETFSRNFVFFIHFKHCPGCVLGNVGKNLLQNELRV